jgi:hypothetical protein
MICYFPQLHAGTERPVYHNTPARQWRPVMQLATGRPLLHCVTSRWQGPCSPQCLPLHCMQWQPGGPSYVLECAGLADLQARFPSVNGCGCGCAGGGRAGRYVIDSGACNRQTDRVGRFLPLIRLIQ